MKTPPRPSLTLSPFIALAMASACLIAERPARACGGCFHRPTENTVVTDHRMAFSVSTQQTVLWDQIKYSGSPSEFSWVLPVRAGAVVQLSHDEWFAALDTMTSPTVSGPSPTCGPSGGCGAFGSRSENTSAGFAGGGPGVQVISQSVVGPYDTVTLQSTDPNALDTWLNANGFVLPDKFRPTVAAYVAGGFDFIALKLRPDQGVDAMQPVRIVTPGADATLPLRMVAAGVGAQVGITLYVISEGRYEANSPFFNAVIDDKKLVWFQSQGRSNYQELSQALMQNHNGHTWLTEYSERTPLTRSANDFSGACGVSPCQSVAGLYFGQCQSKPFISCSPSGAPEGGTAAPGEAAMPDGNSGAGDDVAQGAGDDASPDEEVDGGTADGASPDAKADGAAGDDASLDAKAGASDDASPDAAADGGTGAGASSVDGGGEDANGDAPVIAACNHDPCAPFDDIDVALVGLHANDVWVTRLRALLPVEALSEGDLQIQAEATQAPVSNQHATNTFSDPKENPCGSSASGCSAIAARTSFFEKWLVLGAFAFAGAALARRRSRRQLP